MDRMIDWQTGKYSEAELERMLSELLKEIKAADEESKNRAKYRWDHVAKPLHSLGILEEDIIQIAGITGCSDLSLDKKALVVMCADNGIVEEGVTQTGQEVTAAVTANMTRGDSCVCIMAEQADVDVFPVDIGVACDIGPVGNRHPLINRNIRRGTRNFLKEPSMTRRETLEAILTGISLVEELKEKHYKIIATGEMGIGNTTTSSAVAAVLMNMEPERVTGKGAGLSHAGLERKLGVIKEGIHARKPDPQDGVDVLSKVGGLDIAGLTGIFLGGGIYHIPIVIDGFISATAAVAAMTICHISRDYMIAAHVSAEPAGEHLLCYLEKKPIIRAEMCLGEGTGAVASLPLLEMAVSVYNRMSTFVELEIEDYKPL
ncbi:MAG: nicotinate-nucleotide--dimethylbenzimidazole phosphoribosyltransferase [Clostridium sp.]